MALTGHQEAMELLLIEEADAWFEYLEATRGQTAARYREVEPWAWARLTQRLRARAMSGRGSNSRIPSHGVPLTKPLPRRRVQGT